MDDFTNKVNKEGLYRLPETGVEVWLEQSPPYGSPIIDGFIKAGFKLVEGAEKPSTVTPTEDVYTESVAKNGTPQYRKNGKLITKEEFDSK